jgi:hypothetical protein
MSNIGAEYAGSAASVIWTYGTLTLDLSAHTRSITITPAQDVIDVTAGQDQSRQFIPSFTSWTYAWEGVAQGTTSSLGTIIATALQPATTGTITVGPYGTASGYLKYQLPAFTGGAVTTMPYSDVVTISCTFTANSGGTALVTTF